MQPSPRRTAMEFLAAYDREGSDAYEQHITRVARDWLHLIDATEPMQVLVDRLLEEFAQPTPDSYGCAWDDLKTRFTAWAAAEEYLER